MQINMVGFVGQSDKTGLCNQAFQLAACFIRLPDRDDLLHQTCRQETACLVRYSDKNNLVSKAIKQELLVLSGNQTR